VRNSIPCSTNHLFCHISCLESPEKTGRFARPVFQKCANSRLRNITGKVPKFHWSIALGGCQKSVLRLLSPWQNLKVFSKTPRFDRRRQVICAPTLVAARCRSTSLYSTRFCAGSENLERGCRTRGRNGVRCFVSFVHGGFFARLVSCWLSKCWSLAGDRGPSFRRSKRHGFERHRASNRRDSWETRAARRSNPAAVLIISCMERRREQDAGGRGPPKHAEERRSSVWGFPSA
jgi:hypothetical protein